MGFMTQLKSLKRHIIKIFFSPDHMALSTICSNPRLAVYNAFKIKCRNAITFLLNISVNKCE